MMAQDNGLGTGEGRRSGDRRKAQLPFEGPDRRRGSDRRSGTDRRATARMPGETAAE